MKQTAFGRVLMALGAALALHACAADAIDAPPEGAVFVSIKDNDFQPDTVTVAPGVSVRWTNDGAVLHSVVSDSGAYTSQLLSPTFWFEVRFDSLGAFPYHCSRHLEMTGTVIVQ
jgi:plastocyanin